MKVIIEDWDGDAAIRIPDKAAAMRVLDALTQGCLSQPIASVDGWFTSCTKPRWNFSFFLHQMEKMLSEDFLEF